MDIQMNDEIELISDDEVNRMITAAGKMRRQRKQRASVYSDIEAKKDKTSIIHVGDVYAEEQIAAVAGM